MWCTSIVTNALTLSLSLTVSTFRPPFGVCYPTELEDQEAILVWWLGDNSAQHIPCLFHWCMFWAVSFPCYVCVWTTLFSWNCYNTCNMWAGIIILENESSFNGIKPKWYANRFPYKSIMLLVPGFIMYKWIYLTETRLKLARRFVRVTQTLSMVEWLVTWSASGNTLMETTLTLT